MTGSLTDQSFQEVIVDTTVQPRSFSIERMPGLYQTDVPYAFQDTSTQLQLRPGRNPLAESHRASLGPWNQIWQRIFNRNHLTQTLIP